MLSRLGELSHILRALSLLSFFPIFLMKYKEEKKDEPKVDDTFQAFAVLGIHILTLVGLIRP